MSDHDKTHADDHHGGGGAHEVDKMPSSRLFNLLFGLSALTLVACIGVVQLFYRQVDTIRETRSAKMSFQLAEYRKEMDELVSSWTVVELTDDDGVPEKEGGKSVHQARRTQMPLSEARKRMLEEPQKYLKAQRPYRGWVNPDPSAAKALPPTRLGPQGRPPGPGARQPGLQPMRQPPAGDGAGPAMVRPDAPMGRRPAPAPAEAPEAPAAPSE